MSKLIPLFAFILMPFHCHGQFSDLNMADVYGICVGLEKNNSVWANYGFNNKIHINFKHTAIADELSRQSWRISASYSTDWKVVQVIVNPFVTSDWKISFYNLGSSIKMRYVWKDIVKVGAEYVPYYDKDLKFKHGWSVGALVRLYKQVSCFAEYGRKPDYRIAYERMFMGFDIPVMNLCVKPMIEVPSYDSGIRWTHSKIVVSLYYAFGYNGQSK